MKKCKTEQEAFWAGKFGEHYVSRNILSPEVYAGTVNLWTKILSNIKRKPASVLELGANIGNNLRVLHDLLPNAELAGVEINPKAAAQLREWGKAEVFEASIFEFKPEKQWDLVFTSGVLIHIDPDSLSCVYELMYNASARYISMAEYYSPQTEKISYRGHENKMFRGDFAGGIMGQFADISLCSYGFIYGKDPVFPLDDLTWFLMEK